MQLLLIGQLSASWFRKAGQSSWRQADTWDPSLWSTPGFLSGSFFLRLDSHGRHLNQSSKRKYQDRGACETKEDTAVCLVSEQLKEANQVQEARCVFTVVTTHLPGTQEDWRPPSSLTLQAVPQSDGFFTFPFDSILHFLSRWNVGKRVASKNRTPVCSYWWLLTKMQLQSEHMK